MTSRGLVPLNPILPTPPKHESIDRLCECSGAGSLREQTLGSSLRPRLLLAPFDGRGGHTDDGMRERQKEKNVHRRRPFQLVSSSSSPAGFSGNFKWGGNPVATTKREEKKKENRNCTHGWETGSIVEDTITRLLSIRNRPSPFSGSGPNKNPRSRKKILMIIRRRIN